VLVTQPVCSVCTKENPRVEIQFRARGEIITLFSPGKFCADLGLVMPGLQI
jgi:hypothetical protein